MSRQPDIDNKVNKTLESLEGIQRAESAPYFFTRVKARLERDEKSIWEMMGSFMARPGVAFASLFLVLSFNAYILLEKDTTTEFSATNVVQNTEEEYVLTAANTTTTYDYENIEP